MIKVKEVPKVEVGSLVRTSNTAGSILWYVAELILGGTQAELIAAAPPAIAAVYARVSGRCAWWACA